MDLAQDWQERLTGKDCPLCRQPLENAICRLSSGTVRLVPDGNFPGYCILVAHRHVIEVPDLAPSEQRQWMSDMVSLIRAVQSVCAPQKINIAMLGNEVPHLHCHIIPRYSEDGYWGKPIWLRPAEKSLQLSNEQRESLRRKLLERLALEPGFIALSTGG